MQTVATKEDLATMRKEMTSQTNDLIKAAADPLREEVEGPQKEFNEKAVTKEDVRNIVKEEMEKTEKILSKLLQILESDAESIIHNRDVFTQILAAVDKDTISVIFRAPKQKKQLPEVSTIPVC